MVPPTLLHGFFESGEASHVNADLSTHKDLRLPMLGMNTRKKNVNKEASRRCTLLQTRG